MDLDKRQRITNSDETAAGCESDDVANTDKLACRSYHENSELSKYVLFSFVLSNDTDGAHHLLTSTQMNLRHCLQINSVKTIDQTVENGILQSKKYLQLFNTYLINKFRGKQQHNQIINLFEMACILQSYYGKLDMIKLLSLWDTSISEEVLFHAVGHPLVSPCVARHLILWACFPTHPENEPGTSFSINISYARMVYHLVQVALPLRDVQQKKIIASKIKIALDMGRPAGKYGSPNYVNIVRYCLKCCIRNSDSSLFLHSLKDHITTSSSDMSFKTELDTAVQGMFSLAVKCRAYYIIHLLVICGVDINHPKTTSDKDLPLSLAIGDLFLTLYLLERGANPNQGYSAGNAVFTAKDPIFKRRRQQFYSPMARAIEGKHLLCMWLLQCFGGDINVRYGFFRNTALLDAVSNYPPVHIGEPLSIDNTPRKGHIEDSVLKETTMLIKLGANVDLRDLNGKTALLQATHLQNVNTVRLLLYHNANPELPCHMFVFDHGTPAELALKMQSYRILRLLLLCGAEKPAPLRQNVDFADLPPHEDNRFEYDRRWLINWLTKPHSLQFFCRKAIRKHYGRDLIRTMAIHKYPGRLKDFITLKKKLTQ